MTQQEQSVIIPRGTKLWKYPEKGGCEEIEANTEIRIKTYQLKMNNYYFFLGPTLFKVHRQFVKSLVTAVASLVLISTISFSAFAEKTISEAPPDLWKCVAGEAIGEGERGMEAVAWVYKNRLDKKMKLGCVASKRKDLEKWLNKQPRLALEKSKDIVDKVYSKVSKDPTDGATHYENVEAFGLPYWVKKDKMVITKKIGHHTFFKKAGKK